MFGDGAAVPEPFQITLRADCTGIDRMSFRTFPSSCPMNFFGTLSCFAIRFRFHN